MFLSKMDGYPKQKLKNKNDTNKNVTKMGRDYKRGLL